MQNIEGIEKFFLDCDLQQMFDDIVDFLKENLFGIKKFPDGREYINFNELLYGMKQFGVYFKIKTFKHYL